MTQPASDAVSESCATPERMAAGGRYRYLDVLRGFALLGILLVNIEFFAAPAITATQELAFGWRPVRDLVAGHAVLFFAQYKFITLFSLLFGVGMGILRERAVASGRSYASWMMRRLGVLLLIGLAHAWLVWYGDILVYYAVIGAALCWLAGLSARALTWIGAALIAAPLFLLGAYFVALLVEPGLAEYFEQDPSDLSSAEVAAEAALHGTPSEFFRMLVEANPAFEAAVFREGSYLRATALRVVWWLFGLVEFGLYFGPRIAGLFLLGMAAVRARWFLEPAEHRGRFLRLTLVGLAAGLPLQAAGNLLTGWTEAAPAVAEAGEIGSYLGSLGLAAAYAGLVGLVCASGPVRPRDAGGEQGPVPRDPPRWTRPVEAVGRTALTNYLGQSALCTLFFYGQGPGLGFFGQLDRAAQLGVVVAVWAVGLVLSPLWLAYRPIGPVEWLWRRLTYARRGEGARPANERRRALAGRRPDNPLD